jgi:hypothetical protein
VAQVEKETKLTVSAEDYDLILRRRSVLDRRDQLNIYLHDPSRLQESLGYFRVRFETGRAAVATLKIPLSWEGGVRCMVEIERPLRELGEGFFPRPRRRILVSTGLPTELGAFFARVGIEEVRRLGWVRNLRCVVDVGGGTVELDRTQLPDGSVHHEVEIDTPDDALHQTLAAVVRSWAPSASESRTGKFTLFLEALRRKGFKKTDGEGPDAS